MANIPNTEYVTVNGKGVFMGGKPATRYHGHEMMDLDDAKRKFTDIQKICPQLEELHIGAFKTEGVYATAGEPSGKPGLYAWCRAKFRKGDMGDWVCILPYYSDLMCSRFLVEGAVNEICLDPGLQSALLKRKGKEYNVIKIMQLGKYIVTIKKVR